MRRKKIRKLKLKHKNKCATLEKAMNKKKNLQDNSKMLRLKIGNNENKVKEKNMIIEVSQSIIDVLKSRTLKNSKQRLEVNQHSRNT